MRVLVSFLIIIGSCAKAATEERFFKTGSNAFSKESCDLPSGRIDFELTIFNEGHLPHLIRVNETLQKSKSGEWIDTYGPPSGPRLASVAHVTLRGSDFSKIVFDHPDNSETAKIVVTRHADSDDMEVFNHEMKRLLKLNFLAITEKQYKNGLDALEKMNSAVMTKQDSH